MPTASILLNSFNQRPYLGEAVESALERTYEDFELIVTDNGSTDGSHELLERYRSEPRVRLVLHHVNAAVSQRLNEAIRLASGEFIGFLYSDDVYLPNKLERQIRATRRGGTRVRRRVQPRIGTQREDWTDMASEERGRERGCLRETHARSHRRTGRHAESADSARVLRIHAFHEDVFAEGEAIFLRIAMTHRFLFDPEPTVLLRNHASNAGRAIRQNRDFTRTVLERMRLDPSLGPARVALVDSYESKVMRSWAWQGARVGTEPEWVVETARLAYAADPRCALHPKLAASVLLSHLPNSVRSRLNAVGHQVRRAPGNSTLVEGYTPGAPR